MRYIVLDFDGVICDSQNECFYIANKMFNRKYSNFEVGNFFKNNKRSIISSRPYVISGEDYFLIFEGTFKGLTFSNQSEFNSYKNNNKTSIIEDIKNEFYNTRIEIINEDIDKWMSLNPLYENMYSKIKYLLSDYEIFIVTAKDKSSVCRILDFNKINIKSNNIYGKESGLTKNESINKIILEQKIDQIIFIDDQVENILSVSSPKVSSYFAEWGYNESNQKKIANYNNIPTLELKDFPDIFLKSNI